MHRKSRLKLGTIGHWPKSAPKHLRGQPVMRRVDTGKRHQPNGKRECQRRAKATGAAS